MITLPIYNLPISCLPLCYITAYNSMAIQTWGLYLVEIEV